METKKKAPVSFGKSVAVFVFVFAAILTGMMVLGTSAHMPLVISAGVAAIVAVLSGFTWDELEKGIRFMKESKEDKVKGVILIGCAK